MGTINILTHKCAAFLCLTIVLLYNIGVVAIDEVLMEKHCGRRVSMISRGYHQGRLTLSTEKSFLALSETGRSTDCDVSIYAWYTFPAIMFYFEHLDLDCDNGYFTFFYGKGASQTNVTGINTTLCGKVMPSGVFASEKRDIRIKYTARKKSIQKEVLKLIYTDYRVGDCPSEDTECSNGRCIAFKVSCNGYNSCGDNSSCPLDPIAVVGMVLGIGTLLIIALVVYFRSQKKDTEEQQDSIAVIPSDVQGQEGPLETQNGVPVEGQEGPLQTQNGVPVEGQEGPLQTKNGVPVEGHDLTPDGDAPPAYNAIYTSEDPKPLQKAV